MASKTPEQLFNQALDYFLGIGKDKNILIARHLMQEASDLGLAKASILLADWYVKGFFPSDNFREAIGLYERCCSMGNPQAMCRLGMCYRRGNGVDKDPVKALEYYLNAHDAGMKEACFDIAIAYEKGLGVEKDPEQAVRWYKEGAESGDPSCACNLGFCYCNGVGTPRDLDKARELFLEYSEFSAAVQKNLGIIFLKGTASCPPDEQKGIHWLSIAAGNGDCDSALHLGNIYRNKDRAEAMKWYARAAALDKKKGAYTYAFYLYKYNGEGEWDSAFEWMKISAERGYVPAIFMLGLFYKCGVGTAVNHTKALYWFNLAAENDYEQAYSHIGRYYRTGQAVAVNYEIAFQWFEKAIVSMDDNVRGEALYDYGMMYLEGLGCSKNREKAVAYLCQSKELGCINAINKLKELDNPVPVDARIERNRIKEEGDIVQYVRMMVEDGRYMKNWGPNIIERLEAQIEMVKKHGIVKQRPDGRYMWTLRNVDYAQWMLMVSDKLGLFIGDLQSKQSYHSRYFAPLFLNNKGKEFKAVDLRTNIHKINDLDQIAGDKHSLQFKAIIEEAEKACENSQKSN